MFQSNRCGSNGPARRHGESSISRRELRRGQSRRRATRPGGGPPTWPGAVLNPGGSNSGTPLAAPLTPSPVAGRAAAQMSPGLGSPNVMSPCARRPSSTTLQSSSGARPTRSSHGPAPTTRAFSPQAVALNPVRMGLHRGPTTIIAKWRTSGTPTPYQVETPVSAALPTSPWPAAA